MDNLAGTSYKTGNAAYDDVFEVPLPGAKGAMKAKQQMYGGSEEQGGQNSIPGVGHSGREMRRHSQDLDAEGDVDPASRYLSAHHEMTRNKSGASTRDRVISGEGGYKSKFMKQYESPVTSNVRRSDNNLRTTMIVEACMAAQEVEEALYLMEKT